MEVPLSFHMKGLNIDVQSFKTRILCLAEPNVLVTIKILSPGELSALAPGLYILVQNFVIFKRHLL